MTNAIHIDQQGTLAAIDLDMDYDRVAADIHERLSCRKHTQIRLTAVTYLVVDAHGRLNGHPLNQELTDLAAKYGHNGPIYGEGIVVGHDLEGDISPIRQHELQELVLTHTRPALVGAN